MGSSNFNSKNDFIIVADKSLVKKVEGVVKPGDRLLISGNGGKKFSHNELVLVTSNEKQWIEKYWAGLPKRFKNITKIKRIILVE